MIFQHFLNFLVFYSKEFTFVVPVMKVIKIPHILIPNTLIYQSWENREKRIREALAFRGRVSMFNLKILCVRN